MKQILVASMMALALLASVVSTLGVPSAQAASSVQRTPPAPQLVSMPNGKSVFRIPANAKPDAIAFFKNKFQPVAVASNSLLTPSSLGATATEHGPVQTLPNCLQPPKHLDLLHTPAKLLAAYGIPARDPSVPLSKWLEMASGVTLHVCQTWETNGYMEPNPAWHTGGVGPLVSIQYKNQSWTGKVADQNCGSTGGPITCNDGTHDYVETDTDYYVDGCPATSSPTLSGDIGEAAAWAGLGGSNPNGQYELQQDGTDVTFYENSTDTSWFTEQYPWYEYVGNAGFIYQAALVVNGSQLLIGCQDHMYAQVHDGNCYYMRDLTLGWNFAACAGPNASGQSAELIVERDGGTSNEGVFWGADTIFYGAGVTDAWNGDKYWGYGTIQHDYVNTYLGGYDASDLAVQTGPIENDPGDVPYDEYTVSVVAPCGGFISCY